MTVTRTSAPYATRALRPALAFLFLALGALSFSCSSGPGAAHPVGSSGEEIQGPLNDKITNDAAAQIRALAKLRGRNQEWAEKAVRESIAANADEAVKLNVVDLTAPDLDTLLTDVDGRQVTLESAGQVTLQTADTKVVFNDMNFIERFLDLIADPNIALLLLSLGTIALFLELGHPGAIFPGVFGGISILIGFFALSVLPFNWAGVALIVLAFVLFGLELFIPSHGILGIGGAVALILGGLLLTSGNPPEFQISRWLVVGMAAAMATMVLFVLVNILRLRSMPRRGG